MTATLKNTISKAAALIIGAAAFASCFSHEEVDEHILPGHIMPTFSITLSDGAALSSLSLTGSVSVIVFFNTECPDCRKELPVVQQVADSQPEVRFLCIARSESSNTISQFWLDNNITLPYSPQPDSEIFSLFASSGIPRIYIFDKQRHLVTYFTDNPLPSYSTLNSAIEDAKMQ